MAPDTFVPSTKRGPELAREIIDLIAYEVETPVTPTTNNWDQGSWARANPNEVTDAVEIISPPVDDFGAELALPAGTCGTAMCFAGHAVFLAGDRFMFDSYGHDGIELGAQSGQMISSHPFTGVEFNRVVSSDDGRIVDIHRRAADLLGLDDQEAYLLFSAGNTFEALSVMVENLEKGLHLANKRPVPGRATVGAEQ